MATPRTQITATKLTPDQLKRFKAACEREDTRPAAVLFDAAIRFTKQSEKKEAAQRKAVTTDQ